MKVKKRTSKRTLTKREGKVKVCESQRSLRMESLPEEDAGLVYWEDFCAENGWPKMPTKANIERYMEVFVKDNVDAINQERRSPKGSSKDHHGHSYDYFLGPVWRLKAQPLSSTQHAAATKPRMTAHVSPAPNDNSLNDYIHADDTSRGSTCAMNSNNNKRPMPELDIDREDMAEDSFSCQAVIIQRRADNFESLVTHAKVQVPMIRVRDGFHSFKVQIRCN